MFTVYILRSERDGRYYVGQTSDLGKRLNRHNHGTERATRGRGPWVVVYTDQYDTRAEAMARESKIKARKKRAYIEELIAEYRGVAQPG